MCRSPQCWIKVGAIYAAALGLYKKYGPRPRTRKGINLLYFGCDFSGWYNFGEIVKIVATRCHILKLKCNKCPPHCLGLHKSFRHNQTPFPDLQDAHIRRTGLLPQLVS